MANENTHLEEAVQIALSFLSPRLRELLRRLARRERRPEIQEIAWLIEERARGRLVHRESDVIPLVPLEDLPDHLVEQASARRISRADPETEQRQPHSLASGSPKDPRNKT